MANVDIDKEMSAIKFMEDGLNAHLKDCVIRELEAKYFTAWRDALKVDVQFSDEDKKRE
jgi:hypothetical protein